VSTAEIAIKVENLSKCYHVYDKPRDRLLQMLSFGRKQYFREFWALRDVSFEIKKGETVGIIGRNGSGKSTILQIICGTLNSTSGSVKTKGRIAALLELGSGFNPEFTGRENVYMNAAVLGLNNIEIDARFDEIADFADIGEFIEQPVKTYSSGMQVRLAFAVAINVDPEILIVDEALSVGDELFQRKCFSRIEKIRASGATILFVSHSGSTIVDLCDRAVLLDVGEKILIGSPKLVVGSYQKLIYAPEDKRDGVRKQIRFSDEHIIEITDTDETKLNLAFPNSKSEQEVQEIFDPNLNPSSTIIYESYGVLIEKPKIENLNGKQVNILIKNNIYKYSYLVKFDSYSENVRFGMVIKTLSGIEIGGAVTSPNITDSIKSVPAKTYFKVMFTFKCMINPGMYFLNAGVLGDLGNGEVYLHRLVDAYAFRVSDKQDCSSAIVDFGFVNEVIELRPEEYRI